MSLNVNELTKFKRCVYLHPAIKLMDINTDSKLIFIINFIVFSIYVFRYVTIFVHQFTH